MPRAGTPPARRVLRRPPPRPASRWGCRRSGSPPRWHWRCPQPGGCRRRSAPTASHCRWGSPPEPGYGPRSWRALVGGTAGPAAPGGPAVPGGLAVKLFPCCYAMQRPIAALRAIREQTCGEEVVRVRVATPESATRPLIHDRPRTGLEGKFSMPYAVAAALLDGYPGLDSFTDTAVRRPAAQRIMSVVKADYAPGGSGLLDGEVAIEVELVSGRVVRTRLAQPPGSPLRPPGPGELDGKLAACGQDVPGLLDGLTWEAARALLRRMVPPGEEVTA